MQCEPRRLRGAEEGDGVAGDVDGGALPVEELGVPHVDAAAL